MLFWRCLLFKTQTVTCAGYMRYFHVVSERIPLCFNAQPPPIAPSSAIKPIANVAACFDLRPCPLFIWTFHSNFTIFANSYLFKNHAIIPLFSGNFAILFKMLHVKQSLGLLVNSIIVKRSSFVFVEYSALLLKSFDV